jgi:hypothetical protein
VEPAAFLARFHVAETAHVVHGPEGTA